MAKAEPNERTGIFADLSYEDYDALAGLRKTNMWTFYRRTPAHYLYELKNAKSETDALKLGSATHTIVWEPDQFEARYMVAPPPPPIPSRPDLTTWNRTFSAHKAAWAEVVNAAAEAGKTVLDPAEFDRCRAMRDMLHGHPQARALVKAATPEVSMQWRDAASGMLLKGRLDGLVPNALIYMDLKSCRSAEPVSFGWDAYKRGYHFQMAMYFDGLATLAGRQPDLPVLIAVESDPPFAVACYQLDPEHIEIGRTQYREVLDGIGRCQASGRWPAYDPGLLSLVLPDCAGHELKGADE